MGVTDPVLERAIASARTARLEIEAQADKLRSALGDMADFYAHPAPAVRTWSMANGLTLVFRKSGKGVWGFYVDRYHSSQLSVAMLMHAAAVLEGDAFVSGPVEPVSASEQEG